MRFLIILLFLILGPHIGLGWVIALAFAAVIA